MLKYFLPIIISVYLLLLLATPVYAATVGLSNVPASTNDEQEFAVAVTVSGAAANTTNYLRAAFYSEVAPTSYFGYTFNHLGNWYNGSPSPIDPHQFLQIQIGADGTWSGELKAKVDTEDSDFKGSGNYNFKVGRYTASGTSVSDWSASSLVSITITTPSPSPSPSPSPTSSPNAKSPSPTPKSTKTLAKSPSPNPQAQSSKTQSAAVLGSKLESTPTATPSASPLPSASPSPSPKTEQRSNKTKTATILTGSGLVLIAAALAAFLWRRKTLQKRQNKDQP